MFSPVPEHRPVVLSPWLYSLCLEPRDLAELPPESDSRLVAEPRKSWPPHLSLEPPAHTASCAQSFGWVSCPLFVGKARSYITPEPTKSSIVFGWGAFRATYYGLRTYHRDRISPASPQPLGPGLTCLQQSTGSLNACGLRGITGSEQGAGNRKAGSSAGQGGSFRSGCTGKPFVTQGCGGRA